MTLSHQERVNRAIRRGMIFGGIAGLFAGIAGMLYSWSATLSSVEPGAIILYVAARTHGTISGSLIFCVMVLALFFAFMTVCVMIGALFFGAVMAILIKALLR